MSELVKHYQNTMQGIPQLSNAWGCMISLLDAVLVTGFNHVLVLGLSKANPTSITATINLGNGHGFMDRQVVRITGSTNGWDGDYKVLSTDTNTITVECTATHASTILGTVTCFTAPLDFEIVYQTPTDSTEPKRAYRSTNPESLGLIVLVHDYCVTGAAVNGAKFAKVAIVENMIDIDSIVGNQMPFDFANPNANWVWDGTYHGWSKWYYKTASHSGGEWTGTSDAGVATSGNSEFYIAGNTVNFALSVYISNRNSYSSYGVFEFNDVRYGGKNLCLVAFGLQQRITQNTALYAEARNALVIKELDTEISGSNRRSVNIKFWFNADGVYAQEKAGPLLYLIAPTQDSNNYRPNGISTSKHILSDIVLLNESNNTVGIMPFFKFTTKCENAVVLDAELGKFVSFFRNSTLGICTKNVLMLE